MRSLNDTVARLTRMKRNAGGATTSVKHRLSRLAKFGSNPGNLRAWAYVPEGLRPKAPLVVVLHGCTQTAGGYDESAGWSRLADEHGFALLYPEQKKANNPNLCFNWFLEEDLSRESGEALSIRQMVEALVVARQLDPARVYVAGLSAGGAMAAVMLAAYPDVFAGGAVIAGLPYGIARSVPEAFDLMRGHGIPDASRLSALVRKASNHEGRWPILSVWHGSGDHTVAPANGTALIEQWRGLHGLTAVTREQVLGYPHSTWRDADGRPVIEEYRITGMAHGSPLDVSDPAGGEKAAPFMLDVGISSTRLISEFWGIVPRQARERARPVRSETIGEPAPRSGDAVPSFIGDTIEQALRSAGLMR